MPTHKDDLVELARICLNHAPVLDADAIQDPIVAAGRRAIVNRVTPDLANEDFNPAQPNVWNKTFYQRIIQTKSG
jgi:hypothetical protein